MHFKNPSTKTVHLPYSSQQQVLKHLGFVNFVESYIESWSQILKYGQAGGEYFATMELSVTNYELGLVLQQKSKLWMHCWSVVVVRAPSFDAPAQPCLSLVPCKSVQTTTGKNSHAKSRRWKWTTKRGISYQSSNKCLHDIRQAADCAPETLIISFGLFFLHFDVFLTHLISKYIK